MRFCTPGPRTPISTVSTREPSMPDSDLAHLLLSQSHSKSSKSCGETSVPHQSYSFWYYSDQVVRYRLPRHRTRDRDKRGCSFHGLEGFGVGNDGRERAVGRRATCGREPFSDHCRCRWLRAARDGPPDARLQSRYRRLYLVRALEMG